jgi:starch synthase
MLASENASLIGGKVGGVADVIRDLPDELARMGARVTTIIPSYGFLHKVNRAVKIAAVTYPFGGRRERATIWKARAGKKGVMHLLFDHPEIGGEPIYYNDSSHTPFRRDATKYARFCSGVGKYLQTMSQPFVLHLHDWHTGALLLLVEQHPEFVRLRSTKTIFTIHNLSIQGTRPMSGDPSSVHSWFPELFAHKGWVSVWKDARYKTPCFTPMAAGIRFADAVNTVSPSYSKEILLPSEPRKGRIRGEGLQNLLAGTQAGGRLFGILNGCAYPPRNRAAEPSFEKIYQISLREITSRKISERKINIRPIRGTEPFSPLPNEQGYEQVLEKFENMRGLNPQIVLTGVTRVVEQKVRLLCEKDARGRTALSRLGKLLSKHNAVFVILGTGTPDYESLLQKHTAKEPRIVFINGFFENLSAELYSRGDLFIMPSLFEPCGISQMLAMRAGQPCIVHATGGLKDTVSHMKNGFSFEGDTYADLVDAFLKAADIALRLRASNEKKWNAIRTSARKARFTWSDAAKEYCELLYK